MIPASLTGDTNPWYGNPGGGTFGPQQLVSGTSDGPGEVLTADIDGDGDPGVAAASTNDDRIAWLESLLMPRDGNPDTVPDECDVLDGTGFDRDGVLDSCEIAAGAAARDGNGRLDGPG